MSHVEDKVVGKIGMSGSMHNERSLAQEEGIFGEYIEHIPVNCTEHEEDMDEIFVGKDLQWLGILRISIGTMKSELGLSMLACDGGNSSDWHCSYRDEYHTGRGWR